MRLESIRKFSKLSGDIVSSLPSRNKTLEVAIKNYVKTDLKLFSLSPILPDFFTLFQTFRAGLFVQTNFALNLSLNLHSKF